MDQSGIVGGVIGGVIVAIIFTVFLVVPAEFDKPKVILNNEYVNTIEKTTPLHSKNLSLIEILRA